jgi:hypothetical protein
VAALQRAVSATEQRLVAGEQAWRTGAVSLTISGDSVEVWPRDRVAWLPSVPSLPRRAPKRLQRASRSNSSAAIAPAPFAFTPNSPNQRTPPSGLARSFVSPEV